MSFEFGVEISADDVNQLLDKALEAVGVSVKLVATDLWGNLRTESPVDEGRLAGSFLLEPINDLDWRIHSNVLYALFVQEGTGIFGPHGQPIVPVSANFLVFEIAGETIFARSVRGMEANPYVDRAMEATASRLSEFASMALQEVGIG